VVSVQCMSLFQLDTVRNSSIDREAELVLEDVREDLILMPDGGAREPDAREDLLEVFDIVRPRFNVLVQLLRDKPNGRGADISTGLGFLPVVLARCGLSVIGTERDPATSWFAQQHGIEVRPFTFGEGEPPFEPGSLDFVVLAEVLEHLKAPPIRTMGQMASLLQPGGRLIVTTPNVARLYHLQALAAGENFLEPFPEDTPSGGDPTDFIEHVREYSVREVVDAAEATGVEVEEVLMTGWGQGGYELLPNPYANEIIVLSGRV
jgi:2-polyprenyl-3-methyl-5-hydroxy-6-metoxy-1,4-benzoquinol methylase